jgi:hypothetical protein
MEISYPKPTDLGDPNLPYFAEDVVKDIIPLLKDRNVEDMPLSVFRDREFIYNPNLKDPRFDKK